jgi:Flp pilus assembly protein TadG
MRTLFSITADRRGAAAIDFAFALPVLVAIMLGTLQLGTTLHASGALRHAVGEGVRLAKVDPAATQAEIEAVVRANLPPMDPAKITRLEVSRGTSNGAATGRVTLEYRVDSIVPILPIPSVTLSESKQVYLPA